MAKCFKFRISRLTIPCFRARCSKHPSTRRLSAADDDDFLWKKEDKWHVIAKVYDNNTSPSRRKIHSSSASGDVSLLPYNKKKRTTPRRRRSSRTSRMSTSSADGGRSLFSRDGGYDDEEETEALVSSSRSDAPPARTERRLRKKKPASSVWCVAARVSAFERMMGWKVEGKVRESLVVVKKSEDPYNDFRTSMMEMIVEKKMFEHKDLEQLLSCFLSLNSTHYHPVIVQAFTDIWDTLFCFCITNTS